MTVRNAIATIFGSMLLFGALGTSAGFFLGAWFPGYYLSIVRTAREPGFDAVSFGVGQGLTQGMAAGVLVGLLVVAFLCWRDTRLGRSSELSAQIANLKVSMKGIGRWPVLIVAGVMALGFCFACGWLIGVLGAERMGYHHRYLEEHEAFIPLMATDPALAQLDIDERSDGGVAISGSLANEAEMERLREVAIRAVGENRAKQAISGVSIRQ